LEVRGRVEPKEGRGEEGGGEKRDSYAGKNAEREEGRNFTINHLPTVKSEGKGDTKIQDVVLLKKPL